MTPPLINSAVRKPMRWSVQGIGLVSPSGRDVHEHMAVVGAETSIGCSGTFLTEPIVAGHHETVMACEWLPPAWQGAARIAALARLAVADAVRDLRAIGEGPPLRGEGLATARRMDVALVVDASLSALERNAVAAAVCHELGQASIDAVMDRRGSGALASLLMGWRRAHESARRAVDLLIVAADSWLYRARLESRRARSPQELAAVTPSEGAAALWLRAAHEAPHPAIKTAWASIPWAARVQGMVKVDGEEPAGPLTQLFYQLPTEMDAITQVWGRSAGDADKQRALNRAAARVTMACAEEGKQRLSPEYTQESLTRTVGQLGAAEMTAELVFAIATASARHDPNTHKQKTERAVMVWGGQGDRYAGCVATVPARARAYGFWEAPVVMSPQGWGRPPTAVDLHPVRYVDRSNPGAFVGYLLDELMDDAMNRARERWTLPLCEQAAVEERLDKKCAAMLALAPSMPNWLHQQGYAASNTAAAFVGTCLLSQQVARDVLPVRRLLQWLAGLEGVAAGDGACVDKDAGAGAVWLGAGVEGLMYVGGVPTKALKAVLCPSAGPLAEVQRAVLLHYGVLAAANEAERLKALADDLVGAYDDTDTMPALLTAACARAATQLKECPWSADTLHTWLDRWRHEERGLAQYDLCISAARAIRLHSGRNGEARLDTLLHEPDTVAWLGAAALEIAALDPALMNETWLDELMPLLPMCPRTLQALACVGHPRSYAYLLHHLKSDAWAEDAEEALQVLFGAPTQVRRSPQEWLDWLAAEQYQPSQRLRRGRAWSAEVVMEEIASGKLNRWQLQRRLDELACTAASDDARAIAARAIYVGAPINLLNAQLEILTPPARR